MKRTLNIALFLLSIVCVGQNSNYNLKVKYKMETYFSGLTAYDASLHTSASEAIFKFKNLDQDDIVDKGDNKFDLKITDSTLYYVQSSKTDDKVIELTRGLKKAQFYIIEEKFPEIDWLISSDTTKINNYVCYKATTQFRGRDYTAWFTPEIVSSFGPWKLHGLPGLILMVYDAKKEVFFTAEKIQTVSEPILAMDTSNIDRITRQEHKDLLKKSMEEMGEKFASKAERGLTIKVSTSTIKTIEID